ncbi:hypothetical protein ACSVDM_29570 [Nocardia sp. JW2]|uniref:hypothetical protein n=1 Tax=Nocardia sp. JW2 TaxID=3450738 RepID=UPI003F438BF4
MEASRNMPSNPDPHVENGADIEGTVISVTEMKVTIELTGGKIGEIRAPYLDFSKYRPGQSVQVKILGFRDAIGRYDLMPSNGVSLVDLQATIENAKAVARVLIDEGVPFSQFITDISEHSPLPVNVRFLRLLLTGTSPFDIWTIGALTAGFENEDKIEGAVVAVIEKRWYSILAPSND